MRRTCGALVILALFGTTSCAQKYERAPIAKVNDRAETLAPPPVAQEAARQISPSAALADKAPQRLILELVLSEDHGNFKFGGASLPDSAKARLDEGVAEVKS